MKILNVFDLNFKQLSKLQLPPSVVQQKNNTTSLQPKQLHSVDWFFFSVINIKRYHILCQNMHGACW